MSNWVSRPGTHMHRVAAILPNGYVKEDSPNPGNWNIRVNGKVAIDLRLLLTNQDTWLDAITAF